MDEEKNISLITTCKHAVTKMESAMIDINEIKESDIITESEVECFNQMMEMMGNMMAVIVNMVSERLGMNEEDFMSETINTDDEPVQEVPEDIMNDSIE